MSSIFLFWTPGLQGGETKFLQLSSLLPHSPPHSFYTLPSARERRRGRRISKEKDSSFLTVVVTRTERSLAVSKKELCYDLPPHQSLSTVSLVKVATPHPSTSTSSFSPRPSKPISHFLFFVCLVSNIDPNISKRERGRERTEGESSIIICGVGG